MSADIKCPQCTTSNPVGSAFCDNCGFSLQNVVPAPVAMATPMAGAGSQAGACPSCGYAQNQPGSAFCENCGVPLGGAAPQHVAPPVVNNYAPPQVAPPVVQSYTPPAPPAYPPPAQGVVTGRFVVTGSNANITIPAKPQVLIGREDPVSGIFPDVDLESHDGMNAGVGRQHAQLMAQGGQVVLVDLNTVNGTFVNKQKLPPNQPRPLNNNDEIRFGKLVLTYYSS